jgi:hypothetical protein
MEFDDPIERLAEHVVCKHENLMRILAIQQCA